MAPSTDEAEEMAQQITKAVVSALPAIIAAAIEAHTRGEGTSGTQSEGADLVPAADIAGPHAAAGAADSTSNAGLPAAAGADDSTSNAGLPAAAGADDSTSAGLPPAAAAAAAAAAPTSRRPRLSAVLRSEPAPPPEPAAPAAEAPLASEYIDTLQAQPAARRRKISLFKPGAAAKVDGGGGSNLQRHDVLDLVRGRASSRRATGGKGGKYRARAHTAAGKRAAAQEAALERAEQKFLDSETGDWARFLPETFPHVFLMPDSPPNTAWSLLVTACIVEQAFVVPMEAAFEENWASSTLDLVLAAIFLFDLLSNFFIPVHAEDGTLVFEGRAIASRYVFGPWFTLDVVSGVPWELVDISGAGNLRTAKALKLVRMARLGKVLKSLEKLTGGGVYVAHALLATLLVLHWAACLWRSTADGWDIDDGGAQSGWGRPFAACLYQAAHALWASGVNHGLGTPGAAPTTREYWLCTISLLVGTVMQSVIIGAAANFVNQANRARNQYEERGRLLQYRLEHIGIPAGLRERVSSFNAQLWREYRMLSTDEHDVTEGLSGPLTRDIGLVVHGNMLTSVEFLKDAKLDFVNRLVRLLRPEFFVKSDVVVTKGAVEDWLGVVSRGDLAVLADARVRGRTADEKKHVEKTALVAILRPGDHFGELAFLESAPRSTEIVALTWVTIMALHRGDWRSIVKESPADGNKAETAMRRMMAMRGEQLERTRRLGKEMTEYKSRTGALNRLRGSVVRVMMTRDRRDSQDGGPPAAMEGKTDILAAVRAMRGLGLAAQKEESG